jgi:hypothetical protein
VSILYHVTTRLVCGHPDYVRALACSRRILIAEELEIRGHTPPALPVRIWRRAGNRNRAKPENIQFVDDIKAVGGAITINVPIDVENGLIPKDTHAQLVRLSKHLQANRGR